jgi:uncharacterized membrane protein YbhN (UPF0104 family)
MPEPKARLAQRLVPVLRLAVAVVAIAALSRLIRPADIARAKALVTDVGWPLVLVLLPMPAAMALDARGWQLILIALGQRIPWRRMMELRFSVEAVVLAVPGGAVAGEALKLALLRRRAAVPLTVGGASLALTKANLIGAEAAYLALAGAWVAIGALVAGRHLPSYIPIAAAGAGALATAVASVLLFGLLRRGTWATRLGDWLTRAPIARLRRWAERRRTVFEDLDQGASGYFAVTGAFRVRCFLPFLVEWLMEGVETLIILRCLGVPIGIGEALLLDGVGSLLRALAFFVPAGLGVQDTAHVLLLGWLGIPHPMASGAAFIFLKRTKEVFWVVTGMTFLAVRRDLWATAKTSQER